MSKFKLIAATLAITAISAVPAYAQTTIDNSDTELDNNIEANGNNVAIQDASGGDGGDASADDNQTINAGDNQFGDNSQYAGDDIAIGGDGGDGGENDADVGDEQYEDSFNDEDEFDFSNAFGFGFFSGFFN